MVKTSWKLPLTPRFPSLLGFTPCPRLLMLPGSLPHPVSAGLKAAGRPFACRGRRWPLGPRAGGATHHDGEHEGDDVDGIGGTEAGEDAEEQVTLGLPLRRLVGQLILDVGLGAVLQSPLDVGAGGERGHGAAVRRAGGAESPALRAGGTERRRAKGAAPGRGRAGRGGCPGVSARGWLQGQRWEEQRARRRPPRFPEPRGARAAPAGAPPALPQRGRSAKPAAGPALWELLQRLQLKDLSRVRTTPGRTALNS